MWFSLKRWFLRNSVPSEFLTGSIFHLILDSPHPKIFLQIMTNINTAPTFVVSTGTVKTSIDAGSEGAKFVVFQPDGKIVVAGYSVTGSNFDLALVRFSRNGSLDPTFSGDGVLSADFGSCKT